MTHLMIRTPLIALLIATMLITQPAYAIALPDPLEDMPPAIEDAPDQNIILAGGCFWGVQAVFQHVKGVKQAVSGYTGGFADTAHYHMVSEGNTGHAESVKVTFNPNEISLGKILKIYFAIAHDPTQRDGQGPDRGTQYRSGIFYVKPQQSKIARSYIKQLNESTLFDKPIVTSVSALEAFYPAEDYHQNFAKTHPYHPYILAHDAPKVEKLKKEYPDLYIE